MFKNYVMLLLMCLWICLLAACQPQSVERAESKILKSNAGIAFTLHDIQQVKADVSAHWLTPELMLLPKRTPQQQYQLIRKIEDTLVAIDLTPTTTPLALTQKFPHLADFQAYQLPVKSVEAKQWLKQALWVVSVNKADEIQTVSKVQMGNLLDNLYTASDNDANEITDFGATIDFATTTKSEGVQFKLWAPTAQQVKVLVFNQAKKAITTLPMTFDEHTGAWRAKGDLSLNHAFYQYQLTLFHPQTQQMETLITTDPYSLSLSINSEYSQVIDLNEAVTQPQDWLTQAIPTVNHPEDNIFYETHIRDFSANDGNLADEKSRGKYQAFSEQHSSGITHLKALQKAGINNIHLLPAFDIGTVNEDETQAIDINDPIKKVCRIVPNASICAEKGSDAKEWDVNQSLKSVLMAAVDPKAAQKWVSEIRAFDNYNWGYDPFHYTVPEGSYAINPDGYARIVEFRHMIQSIHQLGFRVIMDVVYNHTHHAGLAKTAVLDKIVPNYYHRLDPLSGNIAQSTCCDNTATERAMMAKLMTDSLVVWARDYKIDGFRFDLMGHQPKSVMLAAREAVRLVDKDTYFYGEGWNFGEVANNQRFVQASQLELGGSEIGTYSDRLRDAVRGSGNNTRNTQGIGNGLFTRPNNLQNQEKSHADYVLLMDQLRVGLAGNLAEFPLKENNALNHTSLDKTVEDHVVLGKDVPYGSQPTGYALDPADTINYVSKHDNQTLWDNSQYRVAFDVSTENRVRMHLQSLSFVLYAQGIPFIHMGSELLRSKSFLRDSYDYGDWFNSVDFSENQNFYNRGLPPAEKDEENWPLIQEVLSKHEGRDQVTAADIHFASEVFNEMVAIRSSSSLFRLTTAQAIIKQVSFLNRGTEQAGLLVMKIDSDESSAIFKNKNKNRNSKTDFQHIVVLFNSSAKTQVFSYDGANNYVLHPILQRSIDEKMRTSSARDNQFSVPAFTSAVFVK